MQTCLQETTNSSVEGHVKRLDGFDARIQVPGSLLQNQVAASVTCDFSCFFWKQSGKETKDMTAQIILNLLHVT